MTSKDAQLRNMLTRPPTPERGVGAAAASDGAPARDAEDLAGDVRFLADGVLRCAMLGRTGAHVTSEDTREAAGQLCERAKAGGLHAEHVVIAIKEAWRYLPEARRWNRDQEAIVLTGVITLCINEFYSARRRR